MIARLRGRLATVGEDGVVVDVGGVGYLVTCGARTLAGLPRAGEAVELEIETQLRAESLTLYGFETALERSWFRLLQTVQGVGARVALAILAALTPDQLAQAVMAADKAALSRASGVGPRLAARIASELKERVGQLAGTVAAGPLRASLAAGLPTAGSAPLEEAISALVNLGYGRSEAHGAIGRVAVQLGPDAALEALIRDGLRELGAGQAAAGASSGSAHGRA